MQSYMTKWFLKEFLEFELHRSSLRNNIYKELDINLFTIMKICKLSITMETLTKNDSVIKPSLFILIFYL